MFFETHLINYTKILEIEKDYSSCTLKVYMEFNHIITFLYETSEALDNAYDNMTEKLVWLSWK